jgi:hypothetical protein
MTSKPPDFADTCREVMARLDAARTLLSSTVTDDLNRAQILRRGLALANIKGARRALDIATEADCTKPGSPTRSGWLRSGTASPASSGDPECALARCRVVTQLPWQCPTRVEPRPGRPSPGNPSSTATLPRHRGRRQHPTTESPQRMPISPYAFRNSTTHEQRIHLQLSEQDCAGCRCTLSRIDRRLGLGAALIAQRGSRPWSRPDGRGAAAGRPSRPPASWA